MLQEKIEQEVFSRRVALDATTSWTTPAGNPRKAPVYEVVVENEYLHKSRTLKDTCLDTLHVKANECLTTWRHQEVKKRVSEAKRDAKEQARDEASSLDVDTKQSLDELRGILHATLVVDDRINWQAQLDTRTFAPFSFSPPPEREPLAPLEMPIKPGLTWLFRSRFSRWQAACEEAKATHERAKLAAHAAWEASVQAHNAAKAQAEEKHAAAEQGFLKAQREYNDAIGRFQEAFESGDPEAIVEYCSRVFELSQYPDVIALEYNVSYDQESSFVTVEIDMPPQGELPPAGYKFISNGNRVEPIPLKKKEAKDLYESVLDQVILRTAHELFEGCYTPHVVGALVNGFVTSVNPATGLDERKRVRSVAAERDTFEALDLSKIDPAACIKGLATSMGSISSTGAA